MPEATGSEDTCERVSEDTYEVGSVTEDACGGVREHAHGRMTEGTQGIKMDYTSQGAHEGTRIQEVLSESRVTHGKAPGDTQTGVSESTDEIICTQEISSDTAWQGTCEGPRVSDTEEIRAGRLTEDTVLEDTGGGVSEGGIRGEDACGNASENAGENARHSTHDAPRTPVEVNHSFQLSPFVAKDTIQQSSQS